MKNAKKCGINMECWSGFTGILGVAFIAVATVLTLITMNGVGFLGMFIVGVMLCRRKMVICPCCDTHCEPSDDACVVESKPKAKKAAPKK
jgi:hypothetical protein